MSPRRIVFLLIALVAAGATIVLGRAWLAAQKPAPEPTVVVAPQKPTTMVLVARGDLKVGQFIRPENLRFQEWPEEGVSSSYILADQHKPEEYFKYAVRSPIGDGEPITLNRIVGPRDGGFLAAVLKPGYRAVTVAVSPASGISGLVFPGDSVDLIATLTLTDKTQKDKVDHKVSETVLKGLRVLALDTRLDDSSLSKEAKDVQIPRTATLEVRPKEAEIVAVVNEMGKLSLSLRALKVDEAGVAVASSDDDQPGLSYTFDSDATKLIDPPGRNSEHMQVVIYKGSTPNVVDFIGGRPSGMQNPPPKDNTNDEDH